MVCSVGLGVLLGQDVNNDPFRKNVQPFLTKNCYECHSGNVPMAGLNLAAFASESDAKKKPEVWEKVLAKLQAGAMPPAGQPVPSAAEKAPVTAWIESISAHNTLSKAFDPGRVTARRLNRVEYNNTIRDLLGVSAHPTSDFPVDDSGYGFDNNGDVLSVSPLLMEKYMAVAKSLSHLAVFGEAYPAKPGRLIRLLNRRSPDADDVLEGGNAGIWLPYSLRGAMYGN